jgi:two-component system phosphate regulon sensor histidine kinase PhoR
LTLTQRLIAGTLLVIGVFVVLTVTSLDRRLRARLREDITAELLREARLVGAQWRPGIDSDSLADGAGQALSHRVTLIAADGVVLGDSEFDTPALGSLENHARRPEVVAALASGEGSAVRVSASAGDEELYAAVRAPPGVARVSISMRSQELLVDRMQRDVISVALFSTIIALALGALFARSVTRPIFELRDDARAIAAGDLSRRPSLAAPGEVGELADAFYRLAEQLGSRLKALEADDALLRALTESLNEGAIAIDAHQRVVHANQQARRLLAVAEPVPFSSDRLPRERMLRDAIAAAVRGEMTDALEVRLGDRVVAVTTRPLAGGGAVVALFDLTTVRKLEAMRRDFVANVSHELKTPLTVVGGFAETLTDERLPIEQRRQFAAMILTHTRRMQRLVDDLLDLSRIESGGWSPNPVPLDVANAANEALGGIRASRNGTDVALRVEVAADATTVKADPTAVRQILSNLVENAIRHTNRGEVVVFSRREHGGVVLGVRDTGSGIPRDALPRIFERFYRVDAARSREDGGTGLGLAIVRHLVEAHGGRVRAESTIGMGTTVEAWLPD